MIDYTSNSIETNTAIINELKEIGMELKAQERKSDNEYYRAGLEVAKQVIVVRLKRIMSSLIHEVADERVNEN